MITFLWNLEFSQNPNTDLIFSTRIFQMMISETDYRNRPSRDNQQIRNYDTNNSQPWWWHGGVATTANMAKEDKANWAWPNGLVDSGPGPKTSTKQMQITLSPPRGEESATPHENRDASIVLPLMNSGHHVSTSHSELFTISMIAGTSYPDAYYGGLIPPLGFQTLNSEYSRIAQGRMALPLAMAEEPVYVNAKQYHGILRRRQSRAKAEVENRITRSQRKPYLHESRHLHAMRRERGCGGRFVSKKKVEPTASMDEDGEGSNLSLGSESMSNGGAYQGIGNGVVLRNFEHQF